MCAKNLIINNKLVKLLKYKFKKTVPYAIFVTSLKLEAIATNKTHIVVWLEDLAVSDFSVLYIDFNLILFLRRTTSKIVFLNLIHFTHKPHQRHTFSGTSELQTTIMLKGISLSLCQIQATICITPSVQIIL